MDLGGRFVRSQDGPCAFTPDGAEQTARFCRSSAGFVGAPGRDAIAASTPRTVAVALTSARAYGVRTQLATVLIMDGLLRRVLYATTTHQY